MKPGILLFALLLCSSVVYAGDLADWKVQMGKFGTPHALIGNRKVVAPSSKRELRPLDKRSAPMTFLQAYEPLNLPPPTLIDSARLSADNVRWIGGQVLSPNDDGIADFSTLYADVTFKLTGGSTYQGPPGKFPFRFMTRKTLTVDGQLISATADTAVSPPLFAPGTHEFTVPNFRLASFNGRDRFGIPSREGFHTVVSTLVLARVPAACTESDVTQCSTYLTLGTMSVTSMFYIDLTPPEIELVSPVPGSVTSDTPHIQILWRDVSGVDFRTFWFDLQDSYVYAWSFAADENGAEYRIAPGEIQRDVWHPLRVEVRDNVGNKAALVGSFKTLGEAARENILRAVTAFEELADTYRVHPANMHPKLSAVVHSEAQYVVKGEQITFEFTTVPLAQTVEEVPVLYHGLVFAFDSEDRLTAVIGEVVPDLHVLPRPFLITELQAYSIAASALSTALPPERFATRYVFTPERITEVTENTSAWRVSVPGYLVDINATDGSIIAIRDTRASSHRSASANVFPFNPQGGSAPIQDVTISGIDDAAEGNSTLTLRGALGGASVAAIPSTCTVTKKDLFGNTTEWSCQDGTSDVANGTDESGQLDFQFDRNTSPLAFRGVNAWYYTEKTFDFWNEVGSPVGNLSALTLALQADGDHRDCNARVTDWLAADGQVSVRIQTLLGATDGDRECIASDEVAGVLTHELGHVYLDTKGLAYDQFYRMAIHEGFSDLNMYFTSQYLAGSGATVVAPGQFTDGHPTRNLSEPSQETIFWQDGSSNPMAILPYCSTGNCTVAYNRDVLLRANGLHYAYGDSIIAPIISADLRIASKASWIDAQEGENIEKQLFRQMVYSVMDSFGTSPPAPHDLANLLVAAMLASSNGSTFVYDLLYELSVAGIASDYAGSVIKPIQTYQPIVSTFWPYRMYSGQPIFRVFGGMAKEVRLVFALDEAMLGEADSAIRLNDMQRQCTDSFARCGDTGWVTLDGDPRWWPYHMKWDSCKGPRTLERQDGSKFVDEDPDNCLTYHSGLVFMPSDTFEKFYPATEEPVSVYVRAYSRITDGTPANLTTDIRSGYLDLYSTSGLLDYEIKLTSAGSDPVQTLYECGGSMFLFYASIIFFPLITPFISVCGSPPMIAESELGSGCNGGGGGGCSVAGGSSLYGVWGLPLTFLVLLLGLFLLRWGRLGKGQ